MTLQLLFGDEIRSHVPKVLSGECVFVRRPRYPKLYILSPWISDVNIEFSDLYVSKEVSKFVRKKGMVDSFLLLDYNIKSINLPYALLLFKLHSACEHYARARLTRKQTKSKGITYEYWYVEHHIGNKIKWCYLGKYEKLPEQYKELIHKDTQTDTQNITESDKP